MNLRDYTTIRTIHEIRLPWRAGLAAAAWLTLALVAWGQIEAALFYAADLAIHGHAAPWGYEE